MKVRKSSRAPDSRDPRGREIWQVDLLMLVLALLSVVSLLWIAFFDVPDGLHAAVVIADYLVCGVFAVEFGWRWRRDGLGWRYPLVYWYDVLGMIPVTSPALRGLRLMRVFVLLARHSKVSERVFGARVTEAFVGRLAQTIVAATATSMERNRDRMEALLVESIRNDPAVRRFKHLPFHHTVVRLVAEASYRIMFQAMTDPRTDEFVADMLRDNIDQVRIRMVTRT